MSLIPTGALFKKLRCRKSSSTFQKFPPPTLPNLVGGPPRVANLRGAFAMGGFAFVLSKILPIPAGESSSFAPILQKQLSAKRIRPLPVQLQTHQFFKNLKPPSLPNQRKSYPNSNSTSNLNCSSLQSPLRWSFVL
ncbi:MAG: hypothetical protein N2035_09185 [Chthoniobacterales bacterium]|nr:hypothetical protein [Chthoniobacterales bacterium]